MTGLILETTRLRLDRLRADDAAFALELLNEPAFLNNIGDKGARDLEAASRYLETGPITSYARNGFGMYRVTLTSSGEPVGMCGLVQREGLELPDLGYAFLQRHWGCGYAQESARAVRDYAQRQLGLSRLAAVTTPDNLDSIKVLLKTGFSGDTRVRLPGQRNDSRLLFWQAA